MNTYIRFVILFFLIYAVLVSDWYTVIDRTLIVSKLIDAKISSVRILSKILSRFVQTLSKLYKYAR